MHQSQYFNTGKFSPSSSETRAPRHTSSDTCAPRHTSSDTCAPRHTSSDTCAPRHTSSETRAPRHTSSDTCAPRHTSSDTCAPRHTSSDTCAPRHTSSDTCAPRHTSSDTCAPRHTSSETRAPRHTSSETRAPGQYVPPRLHQTRELTISMEHSLLHNILTNQEMIMEQLRIIYKTLQGMKVADEAEIGLDPNLLPLGDHSSLHNLEEQLNSSPDLQKQLVNTLALKGGADIRECVWRIMHATIANSLAKQMNMRGVNGKIGFQRLQLRDVVIAAVRRNRLTSGATDQEIDSTVKRWLHLAPDRDGGRKERMKRKESAGNSTY
ncbi:uncharacterized protein LOC127650438 [Xyrauchen texanus]|uniref:uncharacterized protein LOC127650438 n=1 Tax=Xyrauchen texanus TaxID=154827 RepID=UPI0022423F34|nr:uncharacterized protein LOC127650438 [Xyrauchen texanus]